MSRLNFKYFLTALLFLSVCATAFAMRWPLVTSNDRYFRDEDDGRQFNRTVEMAKERDPNPHYFNKPSLNYYLRIPVVVGGYLFAKSKGEITSLDEIRTRDPYGHSGFSYVASHPTILRWNRIFSICLSVGVVAFAFIIAMQLGRSAAYASLAALITGLSPEVLKNSHIIGVDVLMAFLCLACTFIGIRTAESITRSNLVICGLLAGLAGAAKYNALPIVLVPLSVWALKERTRYGLFLTLVSPGVGFFLGCPYSLFSFHEFAQAVAYEAWHYSVAGHKGHSAEPGLEQATFYFGWLIAEGVGIAAGGLALASSVYFVKRRNVSIAVFLSFPIAYSALMISQKTNFTQNMVVMVPYVAVMAVCGLARLAKVAEHESVKRGAPPALGALALIQLGIPCAMFIRLQERAESREVAGAWLSHERTTEQDVAVAGPLQLAPSYLNLPGVDTFTPSEKTSAALVQDGYDYVIMSPLSTVASDRPLFSLEREIPGVLYQQTIPDSPAIRVYRLNTDRIDIASKRAPSSLVLATPDESSGPNCASEGESFCWLTARHTTITLQNRSQEARKVKLAVMSPWPNQQITISTAQGTQLYTGTIEKSSTWTDIPFQLPHHVETVTVTITQVHSLASQRIGSDQRRLGLALRAPVFEPLSESDLEQQKTSVISAYAEPIRLAIIETLTQEIEVPSVPQPPTPIEASQTSAPELPGNLYTLLQALDSEAEGSEDTVPATSNQVVDIPSVTHNADIPQRQEEFRKKFLDTIMAATAEGE